MPERSLIDTNVLVFAFVDDASARHAKAKALLAKCFEGKDAAAISLQNVSEFYSVVTTKLDMPMPADKAQEICERLLEFDGIAKLSPTGKTLLKAMQLNSTHATSYWDCLIAATMLENGISTIRTENVKYFSRLPGIVVSNPFTA
jgi:predicted nucleic acid-binding protein